MVSTNNSLKMAISLKNDRAIKIFLCVVASGIAAYYGDPLVHNNSDAILIITTVITVFAGFLVAIIYIIGDPSLIPSGSWGIAELRRKAVEDAIIRQTWLFYVYLAAIGLLFSGVLLEKQPDSVVSSDVKHLLEYLYVFFAVLSFLFTIGLPGALAKIQLARHDAVIEARRNGEVINSDAAL